MSFKKSVVGFIGIGLSSLAISAYADSLVISNYTNQDSTTKTNGSQKCSSDLLGKTYGVTPRKKKDGTPGKNTIPNTLLRFACTGHLEDCKADVFMDDHCGTKVVATVTFSVTKGLIGNPEIKDPAYSLGGSGFNLSIIGGH